MCEYIRLIHLFFICLSGAALLSCATPAEKIQELAHEHGFARKIIPGQPFKHVIYSQGNLDKSKRVYVYIEGDGSPKITRRVVSSDPTPKNPLMLKLMVETNLPSIYLGRPCYLGLHESVGCNSAVWTSHRYSEENVNSMVSAVNNLVSSQTEIVLFGHSGGGTIATLMAEKLENVVVVVTLSANLDIDKWAALHRYEALHGSMNPSSRQPINSDIYQLHVAGDRDTNVPAELISTYTNARPGIHYRLYRGQDHSCCWQVIWSDLLSEIKAIP